MAATTTIRIERTFGPDPLAEVAVSNPGAFRSRLRKLIREMQAGAGGQVRQASYIYGTAHASKAVTLVTAVVGNKLTINGADMTAAQLHSRGNYIFDGLVEDDSITVNGVEFTAKDEVTDTLLEFEVGANDTESAENAAAVINAHPDLAGVVTAVGAAGLTTTGVVSLRAVEYGTGGDAITLATSSDTHAAKSATTLENGAAPTGDQWDYGDTDTQGAASLAACIVRSSTALIGGHITATSAEGVVTVTAKAKGVSGNAITIAKTGNPLTIAGGATRLTGGTDTTVSL